MSQQETTPYLIGWETLVFILEIKKRETSAKN
jgi:hypothetical protein